MEAPEIVPQVRVFSRSALHQYITSDSKRPSPQKSSLNPYRKRQGLLSFLGLEAVTDAIAEVEREERKENQYLSLNPRPLLEAGA